MSVKTSKRIKKVLRNQPDIFRCMTRSLTLQHWRLIGMVAGKSWILTYSERSSLEAGTWSGLVESILDPLCYKEMNNGRHSWNKVCWNTVQEEGKHCWL